MTWLLVFFFTGLRLTMATTGSTYRNLDSYLRRSLPPNKAFKEMWASSYLVLRHVTYEFIRIQLIYFHVWFKKRYSFIFVYTSDFFFLHVIYFYLCVQFQGIKVDVICWRVLCVWFFRNADSYLMPESHNTLMNMKHFEKVLRLVLMQLEVETTETTQRLETAVQEQKSRRSWMVQTSGEQQSPTVLLQAVWKSTLLFQCVQKHTLYISYSLTHSHTHTRRAWRCDALNPSAAFISTFIKIRRIPDYTQMQLNIWQ